MNTAATVAHVKELIIGLNEYLADAEVAGEVGMAFADDVREAYEHLATREAKPIDELLTHNHRANRNRLETADLVAEMGRTIDWAAVPLEAFALAKKGLQLAPLILALI